MRWASVVVATVGSSSSSSSSCFFLVDEMPSATPMVVGSAAIVSRPRTMVLGGRVESG